ncbi:hypothetical protein PanWU01x14_212300, partial [Parasponia andersonii]
GFDSFTLSVRLNISRSIGVPRTSPYLSRASSTDPVVIARSGLERALAWAISIFVSVSLSRCLTTSCVQIVTSLIPFCLQGKYCQGILSNPN